jgi:putative acetyltransferase
MTIDDYPAVVGLWQRTEGVGLTESDSEEGIASFLRRNPAMSAIALSSSGGLLGALLCGHDGRRGYLHHLAVPLSYRGRGIASRLIAWCFKRLAIEGIPKCNVFLLSDNEPGALFWQHNGWTPRPDLRVFQKAIGPT